MKNKLMILGGCLLAAASLYPILRHQTHLSINTAHSLQSRPDLIVLNATTLSYNKAGLVKSEIKSEKILHYNEQNLTLLFKPRIIAYTETRLPWYIEADQAQSLDGDKVIYLIGHVRLHQPGAINSPQTTITTSRLTYYPSQSIASTEKDVDLVQPNAHLRAKGMRVNLKKGILITEAKTRGTYDPH